jgi:hypothetical protein
MVERPDDHRGGCRFHNLSGDRSSMVERPDDHRGGCRFHNLSGDRSSMVERPPVEGKVAGSIPVDHPQATKKAPHFAGWRMVRGFIFYLLSSSLSGNGS